jgi:hypothetical protein
MRNYMVAVLSSSHEPHAPRPEPDANGHGLPAPAEAHGTPVNGHGRTDGHALAANGHGWADGHGRHHRHNEVVAEGTHTTNPGDSTDAEGLSAAPATTPGDTAAAAAAVLSPHPAAAKPPASPLSMSAAAAPLQRLTSAGLRDGRARLRAHTRLETAAGPVIIHGCAADLLSPVATPAASLQPEGAAPGATPQALPPKPGPVGIAAGIPIIPPGKTAEHEAQAVHAATQQHPPPQQHHHAPRLALSNLDALCFSTACFAIKELVESAAELAASARRIRHAQDDSTRRLYA